MYFPWACLALQRFRFAHLLPGAEWELNPFCCPALFGALPVAILAFLVWLVRVVSGPGSKSLVFICFCCPFRVTVPSVTLINIAEALPFVNREIAVL